MKSGRFFLWIGTAILLLVGLLGQMVLCGWAPPNMPAWVQPLLLAGELALSAALLVQIVLYSHASRHWIRTIWDGMENIGLSAMQSVSFPIALLEENGVVFWYNAAFEAQLHPDNTLLGSPIQQHLRLNLDVLKQERDMLMEQDGRSYQGHCKPCQQHHKSTIVLQFEEVTEYLHLQNEHLNALPCVLLLVIDSYDDVLQYAKESEKAQVSAQVEQLLEQFMNGTDGVIRKVDNDSFYAVMESRHLHTIMSEKFKILDEARSICINDRIHVTFSIGVGFGASSLAESEKFARQSLDMALGRGGDQAAVKTENGFCFFGGASKGIEKKSKTKIRSIAIALQELIEHSDQVFLMGHRFGDLDAIGSACGLAGAIHMMHKPAYVVVNRKNCLAEQLIARMEQEETPPHFLEPLDAMAQITADSLLIVVDTHNKELLESESLYHAARYVVVIDHHRKNVNFIENAVIFHHEPYASSASEMVTEIIQYFRLDRDIPAGYADALLAGIMLDTKNFVMRTGVRTFEAAAYLRKIGADTVQVKTLFSGTISMYQMRSQIVAHAELFHHHAISAVKFQNEDNRLLSAQAADELLSIQGVEASYVLYIANDGVGICARSMGRVNVQLVMEALGGGGHQTMAAAQLHHITLQEAKEKLLQILRDEEQNS